MIIYSTVWQRFDDLGMLYRLDEGTLLAMPLAVELGDPALRELAGEAFEVDFDRADPNELPELRLVRRLLEAEALLELWLDRPADNVERKVLEARTILFLPRGAVG
jgi:hypothetical protein